MAVMKQTGQCSEAISNAPRSGMAPGGRQAARPDVYSSPLDTVAAGILNGVSPMQFVNGINAANRALGNRAFLQWVGEVRSGGEGAPLQLMGKKKKKQGAVEVEAGTGEQAAGTEGVAGSGAEGTVAPGPDAAQPQASGAGSGAETEPVEGAAGGAKKKKKISRVQMALNTLRSEGVAAFGTYIEAEIGESELLRKLVERIMRAEDLGSVRREALEVVEGRLRLLDPQLSQGAGADGTVGVPGAVGRAADVVNRDREPEIAVIAPVKSKLGRRGEELFDACAAGNVGRLKYLLRKVNVDINMGCEFGTLLCCAAYGGRAGIVRELLSVPGIDANLAQPPAATPLFLAAQEGHVEVVKLLLAAPGINANLATLGWVTPLYMAIQQGRVEVVKLLLAAPGINVNLATLEGGTPLLLATQRGDVELVNLLLAAQGIDIDAQTPGGGTALAMAAQKNFPGIVEQLVRRGADVNLGLSDSSTPLGIAAATGHPEVARILVQAPAINIDKATDIGITPLSIAAQRGHKNIVRLLLRKGAAPDGADQTGVSPLHAACLHGHTAIVQMLLYFGADKDAEVEDPDSEGLIYTPYSLAELAGHREEMSILAAHQRHSEAALRFEQLSISEAPAQDTGTPPDGSGTEVEGETVTATARGSPISPTASLPSEAITGTEPPTPLAQAQHALRQEVLGKLDSANLDMLAGIRLLQNVNAAENIDALCVLYNRLAHIERQEERARRQGLRRAVLPAAIEPGPAPAPPGYALGGKTGLDAEAVEEEIKRYLDQAYHRFVGQAVNDMEFGRGKPTTGHPGLWHASAGVAGVGSCSVFYYLEGSGEKLRIVGIGHHAGRAAYRLDYATGELGGPGRILRIA